MLLRGSVKLLAFMFSCLSLLAGKRELGAVSLETKGRKGEELEKEKGKKGTGSIDK